MNNIYKVKKQKRQGTITNIKTGKNIFDKDFICVYFKTSGGAVSWAERCTDSGAEYEALKEYSIGQKVDIFTDSTGSRIFDLRLWPHAVLE